MTNGYNFCMRKIYKSQNLKDITDCYILIERMATANLITPMQYSNMKFCLEKRKRILTFLGREQKKGIDKSLIV